MIDSNTLKALAILNDDFHNSRDQGAPKKILDAMATFQNWGKSFEVGSTAQAGDYALVIALDGRTGKRCIKVMAKLPAGLKLGQSGLQAIMRAWLGGEVITSSVPRALSESRARAVIFAAVLEGDVVEANGAERP